MNSQIFLLLLFVTVAVVTWALVGLLIRLAPRLGLVDRPNERSSHTRVTPRGGGIGFVVAITLAALTLCRTDAECGLRIAEWANAAGPSSSVSPSFPQSPIPSSLLLVLGAALFVALISLWDDFKSLAAGLRFLCHLTAAALAVYLLAPLAAWAVPGGTLQLGAVLAVAVTLVWIVGLTNVYNFMDGIDGIAGVQGVGAGLAWVGAGLYSGQPLVAVFGVLLAAGCTGFLVHNWAPAKIFMGDVGSAFLGFLFAVLPLLAVAGLEGDSVETRAISSRMPVFAVLIVWPFVGDGALTLVRRALKREPVWKAHRSHLYQRLVQTGWTHAQVSGLYAGWVAGCVAVAAGWLVAAPGAAVAAGVMPVTTLAGLYVFVTAREKRDPERET